MPLLASKGAMKDSFHSGGSSIAVEKGTIPPEMV